MALVTGAYQFSFITDGVRDPSTGGNLSGGSVYFHEPGDSTTAKTVWSDVNKTTAITDSEETLDGNGRALVFGDGTYGIIVRDSGGNDLYSIDPYRVRFGGVTNIVTTTGPTYDAEADDQWILVDTSSNNVQINLPPAADKENREPIFIKKVTSDSNTITLDPSGAETIDGSATKVFTLANYTISVVSDGNEWFGGSDTSNADTVDGIDASDTATANYLLALDASKKFPNGPTGEAPLQDDSVRDHHLNVDCAGDGLGQDANGALIVNQGDGIITESDNVAIDDATQAEQEAATSAAKVVTPANQQYHPSSPKAWAQVAGTGTLTTGYNASSSRSGSLGNYTYTVTWGVDFSSSDYAVLITPNFFSGTNARAYGANITAQSAGSISFKIYGIRSGIDEDGISAAFSIVAFGDQ